MTQVNQDLSNYSEQIGFDCLPAGWYEATVIDSEIKEGPKGPYINWTFEIIGHPNRVWDVMSLSSDVSLQRLKTLAKCAGHSNPNYIADTEELHGLSCMVRLKIERSEEYDDKNRITAFKPIEDRKEDPDAEADLGGNGPKSPPEVEKQRMPWEKEARV